MAKPISISFITTCKGRLHHLKQTLPLLYALSPDEIIVVDYNCPDNTGEWVKTNYPEVKLVSAVGAKGFSASNARNLGAAQSNCEWLCFIDADIKSNQEWLRWIRNNLKTGNFYRASVDNGICDHETYGTFICPRKSFIDIGGYDETYQGWGGEDEDIYVRLSLLSKLHQSTYPSRFVTAIRHDDELRTKFYQTNKKTQHLINLCYLESKRHLLINWNKEIPKKTLDAIMKKISMALNNLPHEALDKFTITTDPFELISKYKKSNLLELTVRRRRRYVVFGPKEISVISRSLRM